MTLSAVVVSSILFLELLCILAVLFLERKNPGSSFAWILFLIFFPVVGMVAYFYIGTGYKVNQKKKYAFKAASDALFTRHLGDALPLSDALGFKDANPRLARMVSYLSIAGYSGFTPDNSVEVYTDGNTLFADVLEDIRKASRHVHVLFYIIRNDSIGKELLALLVEKARQGVEVRLMVDSLGSFFAPTALFTALKEAGGEVQDFYPVRISHLAQFRLNFRNHRKIIVIDGLIGYVGGMNVGDEYRGMHKKLVPWRDTHLRLLGTAVWFLQERFAMDWFYAADRDIHKVDVDRYFPRSEHAGSTGIQIVSSGPDAESAPIKGGFMEILYTARSNVWMQTPYFTPDDAFLVAMHSAAMAGVDVRLMIPGISDNQIVHWASLHYARRVCDAGVKVYAYNGFLHAKTVVFDGMAASIGTSNIGYRSFYLNFEITAFIYSQGFARAQETLFLHDMAHCTELTPQWFAKQPLPSRVMQSAARLFAPVM